MSQVRASQAEEAIEPEDPWLDPRTTAILLVGFQNDFFAPDGALRGSIEDDAEWARVLAATVALIDRVRASGVLIAATPLVFTPTYEELRKPVGVFATIKAVGAFQAGQPGARQVAALERFADRTIEVPGKRGLDAFSNTDLDALLRGRGITDVVIAGALTCVCVDSTGRSAYERGYAVTVLSDCTVGRSAFEQTYFGERVFPLYANVVDSSRLADLLGTSEVRVGG